MATWTSIKLDNSKARLSATSINVTPSGLPGDEHVTVQLSKGPDLHSEGFHAVANLTLDEAELLINAIRRAKPVLDTNPDCTQHERHEAINIDAKTKERLRRYLMDKAPRGQGYSAFIEAALDREEAIYDLVAGGMHHGDAVIQVAMEEAYPGSTGGQDRESYTDDQDRESYGEEETPTDPAGVPVERWYGYPQFPLPRAIGTDITEEQSAAVKAELDTADAGLRAEIARSYPLEYDEWSSEVKQGVR